MQQYISRRFIMFFMILVAVLALVFGLVHYALDNKGGDTAANTPVEEGSSDLAAETAAPTPTPSAADPYDAVKNYWSESQLTQAWGPDQVVEHLFFHPIIAYPKYAFYESGASESQRLGLDDWMVTVDEYNKILQSLYDKGFILVAMEDVWSEVTDESGTHMVRNTLMLPEGKKPLIISFDDVNYYPYMLEEGFTSKLVVGDDGEIWAECIEPYTKEVFLTKDLDATPILDQFVYKHPDFSLNGAKAIFSLTGYEGILGYRTQIDSEIPAGTEQEYEANRQKEIEAVKPVIQRLKETGWTFGSHTWGHINLAATSTDLGWVVSARQGLPRVRKRGHQLLLVYQAGHLRRHLRPSPSRRNHAPQRRLHRGIQQVLRHVRDLRPDPAGFRQYMADVITGALHCAAGPQAMPAARQLRIRFPVIPLRPGPTLLGSGSVFVNQNANVKRCHCEPVTDVTGVAIRSPWQRLKSESAAGGDADCHASVRTGSQ